MSLVQLAHDAPIVKQPLQAARRVMHSCTPPEIALSLFPQGSIEGRRDLAGGRLSSDRRALGNSTSGQCFTSLAFSADGAFLLAGGSTKYVCMYDVEEKVMLRRFQVSLLYCVSLI